MYNIFKITEINSEFNICRYIYCPPFNHQFLIQRLSLSDIYSVIKPNQKSYKLWGGLKNVKCLLARKT